MSRTLTRLAAPRIDDPGLLALVLAALVVGAVLLSHAAIVLAAHWRN